MRTFLNAVGFLTIIKIPQKFYLKKHEFWRSAYYFPLTGILIGLIVAIFYYAISFVFPLIACIILTIGLEVLITGAMHLDGFSDTIDGIFCGETDRNKILEIMKKSDIGVFGVTALIFLLALKFSFFYVLLRLGSADVSSTLTLICFMPAFGRWTVNYNFSKYGKFNREGSLAKSFINNGSKRVFLISSVYLFYLFFLSALLPGFFFKGNYFFNFYGLSIQLFKAANVDLNLLFILVPFIKITLIILLIYLCTYLSAKFFVKKIGVLSGDAIGALIEITEVLYLLISFIIIKYV